MRRHHQLRQCVEGTCAAPPIDGCCEVDAECGAGQSCTDGTCQTTVFNVEIVGFAFEPADVAVSAGTTVVWTNLDADQHSVKSMAGDGSVDAGGPLDGPLLSIGETFEYAFDTVGVYEYRCGPHASMVGSITVAQ